MKRSKISHKLAAVATMGMIVGSSTSAEANATNFATMSENLVVASSGFQNLISTVCWLGGAGLGVAGIFKLKQHVDNPGQTPMKDGLIRIGAGGGLLAFPFIQNAMQGSISDGDNAKVDGTVLKMDDAATLFN
ncbi:MAG TPA: hypothetical protein VHP34_08780 [Alphaproteobacteria bacterium]|jgi:hypothetical protein|nr:hypothetical protein [Alphaproteobacteria bacterium]